MSALVSWRPGEGALIPPVGGRAWTTAVPRTCPRCGARHKSRRRPCHRCRNGTYGYRTDTYELTARIGIQPPDVLAWREARILAHIKRIQEVLNP